MSFAYNDSFTYSFSVWIHFISFSCWIAVTRISNTMLNKSGENGHPCLVPDLRKNAFTFSRLSMMLTVGLSYIAFIMWRYVPFISTLLKVFIINGCWILSKAFSASIEVHMIFILQTLMWCVTFVNTEPSLHSLINPTWSWCMTLLMYCWIWYANILLSIFASMFISDIGLQFSFLWCLWFWYQDDVGLIDWVQKHSFLFNFLGIVGQG